MKQTPTSFGHLIPYISPENLTDQYAYEATGSTTYAIINITDTVGRMLENNRYLYIRCLLLDFSNTFEVLTQWIICHD